VRDGRLYLSLHDAIVLAIQNNLDVELNRYNLLASDYDLIRAQRDPAICLEGRKHEISVLSVRRPGAPGFQVTPETGMQRHNPSEVAILVTHLFPMASDWIPVSAHPRTICLPKLKRVPRYERPAGIPLYLLEPDTLQMAHSGIV
jgi:hypothetical protein